MEGDKFMRILFLTIALINCAFSQGMYLTNENGLSAGMFYGRYDTDNKYGFTATYSIKGYFDFTYTRSSILAEERTDNFQNEYFLRGYLLKENKIFISGAFGYIYQKVKTELWKNFTLQETNKGVAYEAGIHFTPEDLKKNKVVVSVFYRYFNLTEELRTPTITNTNLKPNRSLIFDIAVIYFIGQIGIVAGPRVILDFDYKNLYAGLNLSFIISH